ncbi:nucleophile aminohydrolase [Dipodascopsis tothii]|uniref:nucleophile aminohydrolase n=1 Tax=Dipodascopsis tothii TaxID=44089 RepID=UPI0034D012CC
MCRFMVFKGRDPILLAHLLTRPAHSIINQSYDSRLRIDMRRPINGDGFGVGYYPTDPDPEFEDGPCIFCATTPAWNNLNLARLAEKTRSRLMFAHVRASTAGVLSETNCHPFAYHTLMFMHNGQISNFGHIKRRLIERIRDEYFLHIQGGTDSECAFALFLDCLERLGVDPARQEGRFGHALLRQAMLETIALLREWTTDVRARDGGSAEPSLLNFAVTDGESVVATRYITSRTEEAASLHFSSGSRFAEHEPGQYKMERKDRRSDVILVSSEPLTFERNDWVTVPTNTVLTIHDQIVLLHPIVDEYYQSDPAVSRSSNFAASRGLISPIVDDLTTATSQVPPLEREGRRRSIAA